MVFGDDELWGFGGALVRCYGGGRSEALREGTDSMPVAQRLNIEESEDALAFEELEGGDVACIGYVS